MAFIVTVKVVENRVNSHVGNVMVVNVINQYKIPGMTFIKTRVNRPSKPSHVPGTAGSIFSKAEDVAVVMALVMISLEWAEASAGLIIREGMLSFD